MSRRGGYQANAAVLGVLTLIGVVVAAVTIGVASARGANQTSGADRMSGTAQLAGASVVDASTLDASVAGPETAVTYPVSEAAQRQALVRWTPRRMQGATAAALPRSLIRTAYPGVTRGPAQPARSQASPEITAPPKGTPRAASFSGSPTTGVLFYTAGGKGHFCTASVVDSTADDLALTAAHCVYWEGLATNIEYVPGYHDGRRPYGVWPVRAITVASGWKLSHDPDLDFAFLTLASAHGRQIQARTGGLTIGFTRWYREKIEVIGHNDSDAEPIRCATKSLRFRTGQMEFYCHGFWTGTSGGPWIIGYNARNGTGTVFGVIGGYELGGDYEWASYSAYFGSATRALYQQAERQAAPHPHPHPTPTPLKTPTAAPTTAWPTAPPTATAPDTTNPTSPATGTPSAVVSAATPLSPATPSPTGSVSIVYRAPVVPG
jgi:V8-like Glu-specific endopeptidase